MLLSYRALLARAGARPLALACALGWLAFGGYALAVILAVHAISGSFPEAGGAVAAFAAGSGIGAPVRGRLVDRRGPGSLAVFAVGHATAATLLVVSCALRLHAVPVLVSAALAGLLAPPLIATARSVWAEVAGELTPTAHALNAALGDVGQLAGPGLVGGVAAAFSPVVAFASLAASASAAAAFVAVRAGVQRTANVDIGRRSRGRGPLLASPGLQTALLSDASLGLAFGAVEVAVTALCARAHAAEWAAVPLSASAVGSVVVSLWSGTGRLARSSSWRYIAGCWIAAVLLPLLLVVRSVAGAACVLAATGAGMGLLAVALYELLDEVVPAHRSVEAFTWLTTGQAAGVALGSALAGQLTRDGTTVAFALACASALGAAVVVSMRRATLRTSDELDQGLAG